MVFSFPGKGKALSSSRNANWAKIRRKKDGQSFSAYPIPKGNRITVKDEYEVCAIGSVSREGQVYTDHLPYYDQEGDGSFYRPLTDQEMQDELARLRTFGYDMPFKTDEENWNWHKRTR